MLNEGIKAPAFTLPDQEGQEHTLSDYQGSWILLYFYPKDDTPGCTKEACGIRDVWGDYQKAGLHVFGVSADSVAKHKKFVEKYTLPFTLLSDEEKTMLEAYGVWGKKKFMGREYMGIHRVSYLINPEGVIAKVYPKVKPADHAQEVLTDLEELKNA